MTLTATDLFCGAGGSSLGARTAGIELRMAANHWQTAIDVHQAHFPDAGHDIADISQADPRRYPRTNILLASPECTNHSQARGVSRKKQNPSLWDAPDPAAERSRARLCDITAEGVAAEGFPDWSPGEFVSFFCDTFGTHDATLLTVLAWEYL